MARIDERLEQADDGLALAQRAISSARGFWTRRMTSASRVQLVARDERGAGVGERRSGIAAPAPAPCLDEDLAPGRDQLASASGTSATRRSSGALSFATPTFMGDSSHGQRGAGVSGARIAER